MLEPVREGLRIAVVGAGISGLSAAYLLSRRHRVELFEKDRRLRDLQLVLTRPGNLSLRGRPAYRSVAA